MTVTTSLLPPMLADDFASWGVHHGGCALVGVDGVIASAGNLSEVLPWASVSKVATALAVLDVVQDGLLDLHTPAGPEGSTVRHLLAHASGLAFDDDRVLSAPGQRRIYSNVGIDQVTTVAVAAAGARDAATLLAERVFGPLGMADTCLRGPAAHGVRGPVADLSRLAGELVNPSVLPESVHRSLRTVAFPDLAGVLPGYGRQDPNDWGLGAELRGRKSPHWMPDQAAPSAFGHFGQAGSFLWVDPTRGVAGVALTGTDFGPWAVESWQRSNTQWVSEWDKEGFAS